jgi:hypothetical protein
MQHAALASALTTSGAPQGLFQGALDEVRIWSLARTESQITATIKHSARYAGHRLVARWG